MTESPFPMNSIVEVIADEGVDGDPPIGEHLRVVDFCPSNGQIYVDWKAAKSPWPMLPSSVRLVTEKEEIFLWLIQRVQGSDDFDIFISAVVAARTIDEALDIHPSGTAPQWRHDDIEIVRTWARDDRWVPNPDFVMATKIGSALPGLNVGAVLHSSFRHG